MRKTELGFHLNSDNRNLIMPAHEAPMPSAPHRPVPGPWLGPRRSCDCARRQPEHHAHGPAALVRHVADAALVDERRGLASEELVVAHKEVVADAQRGVVDDLAPALAGGVGGVLALPVEMGVVHPTTAQWLKAVNSCNREQRCQVCCEWVSLRHIGW